MIYSPAIGQYGPADTLILTVESLPLLKLTAVPSFFVSLKSNLGFAPDLFDLAFAMIVSYRLLAKI